MAARLVARWLAPLALAAVIAAIYLLAHRELGKSHAAVHHQPPAVARQVVIPQRSTAAPTRDYVVKAGDTLSGIAVRNHVSLNTLENLNKNVNPNTLQTGQHLHLP